MIKSCLICNKEFYTKPCEPKRNNGKFCSRKCFYKSRVGILFSEETKEKISKGLKEFFKNNVSWHLGKHHSEETKRKIGDAHRGSKSWRWRGKQICTGYVYLFNPTHPFAVKKGYVKRSRLIMEQKLGRFLNSKEIVHHINGIRTDDRLENLQLFVNKSKHNKFHFPKGSIFGKNKYL